MKYKLVIGKKIFVDKNSGKIYNNYNNQIKNHYNN